MAAWCRMAPISQIYIAKLHQKLRRGSKTYREGRLNWPSVNYGRDNRNLMRYRSYKRVKGCLSLSSGFQNALCEVRLCRLG